MAASGRPNCPAAGTGAKTRRFLRGVGAMGDDHAVAVRPRGGVAPGGVGQCAQGTCLCCRSKNNAVALQLGKLALGPARRQQRTGQSAPAVPVVSTALAAWPRDGAAGGEQGQSRQRRHHWKGLSFGSRNSARMLSGERKLRFNCFGRNRLHEPARVDALRPRRRS